MAQFNAKSAGLISLFAVPVATAGVYLFNQPRPSPAFAVCVSQPLVFADGEASGCYSPQQVQALRSRPISFGENQGVTGLQMSPESGEGAREVRTCQDYAAAQSAGLVALSTFDMSMESFFTKTCGTLNAIASARPAQQSYLASPRVTLGDLNLVSAAAIGLIVESPGPARTVSDLVTAGQIKVSGGGDAPLQIQGPNASGELGEIARGDFNGDGLEDMLVFQAVHAEGGSYRAYDTEILTRRTADGPLEVTR